MATKNLTNETCAAQLVQLVPALMRLVRRSARQADPQLSVAHLRILEYLAHHAGASLTELSSELEITNATASSHIEKLVQRQFVQRMEDPSERRRVVLTLTDAGSMRLNAVRKLAAAAFSELLSPLTNDKLTAVHEALKTLDEAAKTLAGKEDNDGGAEE